MTDKMKHCSIEQISKDLYRLKIITAFKDEHTMTITKETLNALVNLNMSFVGSPTFNIHKTYDEFGDVEWEDACCGLLPVFCSCQQEEEK
jgi:hypothetical protein